MVHLRTDIGAQKSYVGEDTDTYVDNLETDVLIVGAGFGGVYLMHRLRDELGFKCKIYEAGEELGGIWHWNCYPGARVDTQVPIYEYSLPEIWKDWTWTEKYPGFAELRQYFAHVERKLNIKKDTAFNTRVVGAEFNKQTHKWDIQTEDGRTAHARIFINAIGFAAKRHFPDWKGLDTFKGEMHHSSFWPESGVDMKGKRVAVIGTGSTGIQIAQESAKDADHVTVFQRTPNLCLPMRQRKLTKEEQDKAKSEYPELYKYRMTTFAGFGYDFVDKNTFDDSEEERQQFYEEMWEEGGFKFWLATYKDMLFDKKANEQAYNFWVKKTRERIKDPRKRDILAPLDSPHPWGTKRPSLEQNYYEQLDKPQNNVIDIKANPIVEVKENGILTQDGQLHEFDIIALATGFDSVTGGMKNMGLKDVNGKLLKDKWAQGTHSYLGMTCNDFPNMFFLYGAQGPTAFSNGPSCVEVQGDWIVDTIAKLRNENITYLNATKEGEEEWRQKVTELSEKTLFHTVDSWYMGANIPGKPREQLNYSGGIPLYEKECREVLNNGFAGFTTQAPAAQA
ncbi:hypothetical protein LTR85_003159 [Meristemomyces frigidus]|nr:hypothetical protein LTR85_003159 [Meristemomyces frigidus]